MIYVFTLTSKIQTPHTSFNNRGINYPANIQAFG